MKKALRIAGVNLGLVLLVLVAAELIFGNWIFGPDYNVLNVPRNETRYFDVASFMPGEQVITYTRDEHGLRGDYGGDPARIDALVLGGSTTNERYVDDEKSWVARLQKRFRDAGSGLTIVNAAVDGQSTVGHIRTFDVWFPKIPDLAPRYVLAYVGINDTVVTDTDVRKFDEMRSPEAGRRFRQFFLNHSILYTQFRRIRGTFVARRTRLIHGANLTREGVWRNVADDVPIEAYRSELAGPLGAYGERLKILAGRIRDFGAQPIFVTQRRGDFKIDGGQMQQLVRRAANGSPPASTSIRNFRVLQTFNEVTLAVCREMDLFCVDLAAEITFADGDFYDQVHTTPSGSDKIAAYLFDKLKNRLESK